MTTYASDLFVRTVSNGWGTANTGGDWTMVGTSSLFSVASATGGRMAVSAGATLRGNLLDVSALDSDTLVRVQLSQLANTASGINAYIEARYTSSANHYRARFQFLPSGVIALGLDAGSTALVSPQTLAITHTATTDKFWVRLQVQSTNPTALRARAWKDGSAEPSTWQVSTTDSTAGIQVAGAPGLRCFIGSQQNPSPVNVDWTSLSVTSLSTLGGVGASVTGGSGTLHVSATSVVRVRGTGAATSGGTGTLSGLNDPELASFGGDTPFSRGLPRPAAVILVPKGPGDQFKAELRKPVHTVAARLDILDTSFRPVKTVKSYSGTDPNDALIDGTVDLDVTRGTRRTLTMSLLNPDGAFTPDKNALSDIDWDGFFYVNRLIRLWRGVRYDSGEEELVPIGTFMVDKAETLVERGMSTVVIAGSDLWKKFTKSQFGLPRKFAKGTALNTVIKTLATEAGVTQINLDPLAGRTSASNTLQTDKNVEADETRGDVLMDLCADYGIEIFFNPMGVLVTRDFQSPFNRKLAWDFAQDDTMIFFMRSTINDDRLYNHAIVVGTAMASDKDNPVIYKAELKDTDSSSPTRVTLIGDRVFRYESNLLGSQESVNKSVTKIFYEHFLLSNSVDLEAVCNPSLEGNDVIRIIEPTFTGLNNRFLISALSVPLVTSKQKINMSRVLNIVPS